MAPSNQDDFDGYRKWLGIANKKRPPTHYELLAISLDEDDPDVIRAAVEQRRHYVESKRGEGHDAVVTEILYRISEAEATLLNDEMRRDYDRQQDLFERRRKNRQVDPYAPRSRVKSRPGKTVGEDSGIVKTFVGIMAVVCVGFGGMAWFSFQMPWSKKAEHLAEPAPAAQVAAPVAVQRQPEPVQAAPVVKAPEQPVPQDTPGTRVVITLPKSGEATIRIGRKSEIPLAAATGEPVSLTHFPNASVRKTDNMHAIEWDFRRVGEASELRPIPGSKPLTGAEVQLNKQRGVLVLTEAHIPMQQWFELPMEISFDIDGVGPKGWLELGLNRLSLDKTSGHGDFWIKSDEGLTLPLKLAANWETNGQPLKQLVSERVVSAVQTIPFTMDKSELVDGNRFSFSVASVGTPPITFSRLSMSGAIVPEQPVKQEKPKDATEGVALFNGTDLSGWTVVTHKGTKDPSKNTWIADSDRNVLASMGEELNELRTEGKYDNFRLNLEWRFTPGRIVSPNGSGVIIRSNGLDKGEFNPRGIEIDLREEPQDPKAMHPGNFIAYNMSIKNFDGETQGEVGEGKPPRRLKRLKKPELRPSGQWNTTTITCQGDRIRVEMNGELINEGWGMPVEAGHICLRNQNSSIEFRNIKIKPLSDATEPTKEDATANAMKAIQGEWRCVVLQQNGGDGLTINDEKLKSQDRRMTFKGNNFEMMRTREGNRKGYTGKFEINAETGHFDFIGKGPAGGLIEWIGIYSVEGDSLKLCFRVKNNDKATRPTAFKTDNSDDANTMLFEEYRRVGPAGTVDGISSSESAAHWKFWDPLGAGKSLEQAFIVSRDGTLISTANAKEVCIATVEEFSECTLKLEYQFPDGEVKGGPYVSVGSSRPNPDGNDFVTKFPFGFETKLAPIEAGQIILPPRESKLQLHPDQKRDPNDSRRIFPIRPPKVKSEDWNKLEIKSDKARNLTVKINTATVNQLMKPQSVTGHVLIWPGVSEIRIRNVVIANEKGETKMSFDNIQQ